MLINIHIAHPAHAHFFRHFIGMMSRRGHHFIITARPKEVTFDLLDSWGLRYHAVGSHAVGRAQKAIEMLRTEREMLGLLRADVPDLIMGISNMYGAQVGRLLDRPSLVFTDTEHARLENALAFPFATRIVVPACYMRSLGRHERKVERYRGYHELAYLHPKYFTPDPSVLAELGMRMGEPFVIARFVSWGAAHDAGRSGFSLEQMRALVSRLSRRAKVFISAESALPADLEQHRLPILPARIHDALALAQLYVGEGATMASESAVVGTPSIFCSPLELGTIREQERRFGLVVSVSRPQKAIEAATKLLDDPNLAPRWRNGRDRMLGQMVDVSEFMVLLAERFFDANEGNE